MSGTIDDAIVLGDSSDDEEIAQPSSTGSTGTFRYGVFTSAGPPVPMQLLTNQAAMPGIKIEVDEEEPSSGQGREQASQNERETEDRSDGQESNLDADQFGYPRHNWIEAFSLKGHSGEASSYFLDRRHGEVPAGQAIPGTVVPKMPKSSFLQVDGDPECEFSSLHHFGCLDSQRQPIFKESAESTIDSHEEGISTKTGTNTEKPAMEQTMPDLSLSALSEKSHEKPSFTSDLSIQDSRAGTRDPRSEADTTQRKSQSPSTRTIVCERDSTDDIRASVSPRTGYTKIGSYYQCKYCQFRSLHEEKVVHHRKTHNSMTESTSQLSDIAQKGKFKCTLCIEVMDSHRLLMLHKARAHRAPVNLRIKLKSNRKGFWTKVKQFQSFPCDLCPFQPNSKFQAERHKALHAKPDSYCCPICKRPFPNKDLVNGHCYKVHNKTFESIKPQGPQPSQPRRRGRPRKYVHLEQKLKESNWTEGLTQSQMSFVEMCLMPSGDFFCRCCSYKCQQVHRMKQHILTIRHRRISEAKWSVQVGRCHICKICNYETKVPGNMKIHLRTQKHKWALRKSYLQLKWSLKDTDVSMEEGHTESHSPLTDEITPEDGGKIFTAEQKSFLHEKCNTSAEGKWCRKTESQNVQQVQNTASSKAIVESKETSSVSPEPSKRTIRKGSDLLRTKIRISEAKWSAQVGRCHICKICNYETKVPGNMKIHLRTQKHQSALQKSYLQLKRSLKDTDVSMEEGHSQSHSPLTDEKTPEDGGTTFSAEQKSILDEKCNTSAEGKWHRKTESQNVQVQNTASWKAIVESKETSSVSPEPYKRTIRKGSDLLRTKTVALESDLDEFAERPYACALCFFRTGHLEDLSQHVQNHLTGINYKKQEASITTSGIQDTGLPSSTPISETSTLGIFHFPTTQRAHIGNSLSIAQPANIPQMLRQQQQQQHHHHHQHHPQSSESSNSVNMMGPLHMPYPTLQLSYSNPSSTMMPLPVYNTATANMPHFQPHPNPNQFPSSPNQINTEDVLDLGNDFTKEPGNVQPYMCLYDRCRFVNLASIVKHFEMAHQGIIHLKSQQARMRAKATLSAHLDAQSRSRVGLHEGDVNIQVID